MNIIFRQSAPGGSLEQFGIENCYLKELTVARDRRRISSKAHHHTGFEVHIVTRGAQIYQVGQQQRTVSAGRFLLLGPGQSHQVLAAEDYTEKYSLSFSFRGVLPVGELTGATPAPITDAIGRILREAALKKASSPLLMEHSVLEIIVLLLRRAGLNEGAAPAAPNDNTVLQLADQYVRDNLAGCPTVAEVAAYCNLSPKQLTRLFLRYEGCAPGAYITALRVRRIEELLADPSLSLGEISEEMNFSSEYYFNAFFKKHAGMPPGQYRKMLQN